MRSSLYPPSPFPVLLLLSLLAAPAPISRAQVSVGGQVYSQLMEFYPGAPPACGDARQELRIDVDAGAAVTVASYESDDAVILSRHDDELLTFLLGPAACRVGVAIGKYVPQVIGSTLAGGERGWAPVPRQSDGRTFSRRALDAGPACGSAKVHLEAGGGKVLMHLISEVVDEPVSDRTDNGFVRPNGPLRIAIGRRDCEINLLVFRAD